MLDEFVDLLFGDQEGVVYAPSKRPGTGRWKQHFFEWPLQRSELLQHFRTLADKNEVYISPILFSEKRVAPDTFKGTYYVWAEFDGKVPDNADLSPTITVQSSIPGHEHWYWRLDEFCTDPKIATGITRKLTYHYGADRSGWDYAQVLRPPDTINHKRNRAQVSVTHSNGAIYSVGDFDSIPDPPVATVKLSIETVEELPKLDPIIAKYSWKPDTYELFSKIVRQGTRSDALARLAFDCVEMGMSNLEVITVLEDADRRWKKFVNRTDRLKRLFGILEYVRTQKALQAETTVDKPGGLFRFLDFINTEIKLKWIAPGLIPVAGSGIIYGPAEVGKSTWSLRMGMSIASGDDSYLVWPIEKQTKVMFLSLEMAHDELQHFFAHMDLNEETKTTLQENFFVWPVGHAYPLDVPEYQQEILSYVDQFQIGLIIIDSLALSMYGSISSDDDVKRLNSFFNEDLRSERGCGYWLIHHPHKPNPERKETFYEMFGSAYIGNNAQTIVNLRYAVRKSNRLTCEVMKSRLSLNKPKFDLIRKSDRSFELAAGSRPSTDSNKDSTDTVSGNRTLGTNFTSSGLGK